MRDRRLAALGLMLSGTALLWSSLLGPGVSPARAAPAPFADFGVRDLVATPDRMLALVCDDVAGGRRLDLVAVGQAGNRAPFATIVDQMPADQCYVPSVAMSPGLGGFPAGHLYVSIGTSIYHVTPDGRTVNLFATIPAASGPINHYHVMTFDDIGSFGGDMLVAGALGRLFRVNSLGVSVQFGLVPQTDCTASGEFDLPVPSQDTFRSAVDVAPRTFAPFGGQLLVPDWCHERLWAASAAGAISTVTAADSPQEVQVIPDSVCTYGGTGSSYFLSRKEVTGGQALYAFPAGDFADIRGSVLLSSSQGLLVVRSQNGAVSSALFAGSFGTETSGGFVECPPPERAVSAADTNVVEGDAGVTTANVDITLPSPSSQEVRVRWATADGTATAGSDYNAASSTVSFAPGETAKTVSVEVLGDTTPEPNETFSVNLQPVKNATLARGQATVTIADDDASPVVSSLVPDSGPVAGGTRVAVIGTRLGGAQVVRFGPVDVAAHPCPAGGGSGRSPCFTEESPTRLSVYSPTAAAPGAVHVRVTTASGTSLPTAADVFNYLDERVAPQAADPPAPLGEPPPGAPPGHVAPPPPAPPGGSPAPPGTPSVGPGPAPSPTPGHVPGQAPGPAQAPSPTPGHAPVPGQAPGPSQAPSPIQAPAPGASPGAQVGLGAAPAATPEAAVRHAMVRRHEADPITAAGGAVLVAFGCALMASANRVDQVRRSAPAVSC